jgi:NADH dehydrogenase
VILGRDPSIFDAVNRAGTAHLVAAAAAAGVRHFVYVSSASVVYPRLTPYGRSKLQAERIVASEPRMRHTIVRPTLVYDDSGGGQEFALFRDYLRRFPVVPFIGPTHGPRAAKKRPVHASDVVDALARMVGNPGTWGQTLNISGPETITLADLGRLLLSLDNHPKMFLPVPVGFCRFVAAALGAIMNDPPLTPYGIAGFTNHADLDPSETMRLLGWQPRDLHTGLRAVGVTQPDGLPWKDHPVVEWSKARAAAPSAEGSSE